VTFADLRKVGFKLSGTWKLGDDDRLYLEGQMPAEAGLYIFAHQETVFYVGVTSRTIHKRVRSYAWRFKTLKGNRSVYKGIEDSIRAGRQVDVYTMCGVSPRWGKWRELPLDYLVGIESGLIETLNPPWNTSNAIGRAKRASSGLPT
jgi:hypothetical protein